MSVTFKVTSNDVELNFKELWETVAEEAVQRVQGRTPCFGRLRDSVQSDSVEDEGFLIGSDVPYAIFVEEGTIHMDPVGMFRTTMQELPDIIESKKEVLVK